MPDSNADLAREIRNLKEEIRQMKGLIDLLVSLVVESDDDEEDDMSDLLLSGASEVPRFNN
ncbi:MAG TPA: hypothetical protein VMW85_02955 [Methanomassiliicoccales archaeon]|nr:hypothetical protein [Methanomassiliicoccales archaeon]